jgi:hypothetical protein
MIQEYSRHYQKLSPVNDHQGDLEIHNNPCAFYEDLLSLNRKHRCSFTFLHYTSNVQDLIDNILITHSISLLTFAT